jgi:hypothetical protein
MWTIEKGVPIPQGGRQGPGRKSEFRQAVEALGIGDSVVVSGMTSNGLCARLAIIGEANGGRKFTTRAEGNARRVWRAS